MEEALSRLTIAAELLALGCVPLVLARRKDAPSTIAWILTLVFLPFVGVVLFWFLGRDRVRRPVRDKAAVALEFQDRVVLAPLSENGELLRHRPSSKPGDTGVMQLAARVGDRELALGNEVGVYTDAPSTYDAKVDAIKAATHHIHMQYYIFAPDDVGRRFREALIEASKRGVKVRLLVDGLGSRRLGGKFVRSMREAGIEIATFLPIAPVRRAWTLNLRNHRKLMVVDGRVGFVGGINIGSMFLPWADLHLRIEGPVVRQLQSVFAEDWYFATRRALTDTACFPQLPRVGDSAVQVVDSGPDARVWAIHRIYIAAISTAKSHVLIATPYFVPDQAMRVALQTSALRGVRVSLVVPKKSNHRVTDFAGRSCYEELLEAGVQINEYGEGMVHSKMMVVDGRFAVIGSANLDVRSFRLNFELVAILWGSHEIKDLETLFERYLSKSVRLTLAEWLKRPLFDKVKEGFGRLLSPLL